MNFYIPVWGGEGVKQAFSSPDPIYLQNERLDLRIDIFRSTPGLNRSDISNEINC